MAARVGRRTSAALLTAALVLGPALVVPAGLPAQAADAPVMVGTGALRAVVHEDPWRLELLDGSGRVVLSEATGTGVGPDGTLGFRTAGVWRHATRVVSSRREGPAYAAVLATTDPLRQIEIRLAPDNEGVLALDATVTGAATADVDGIGMGFAAAPDERYLGFGERSNAVDQRGNVVESYVSDGPYQDEEYPFLNAFVPPWGLRERRDATYFPIPWLLSTKGYGVLVDNPETSYFRLDGDDAWSVEVVAAPEGELAPPRAMDQLQLRFFGGPNPADALQRFTRSTGRQPRPEPWALGPWFQAKGDELAAVRALQQADAPLSALQTYLHYLPCGDQRGVESDQPERTAAAHAAGVAITTYVNPMVCADYSDAYDGARAAGALTRTATGEPYLYRYGASPDDSNVVGQYDFFRPQGAAAYGERLGEAITDGYDGWMEDFGEYTPLDSVSGDGIPGSAAHNPYVTRYHCAAYEQARQRRAGIVRFQRSGWTGSAACADVVWGGDPTTGWGFDGLRSSVRQALSIGTSGVGVWGSDIGGFFAIGRNALSPELLTRWVQFGAVSPVMRTQANGVALPSKARPQVTDPDQLPNWRRYAKLHTQLHPYLVAAQDEYERSGLPVMRHLSLVAPQDAAAARDDQFLFGPDLLAAPVLDPGVTEREVQLPAGGWVDLWRAARYDSATGGLQLRRADVLPGGRAVTVPAPLDELPLLVRAGAVLPLLPPDVDTLTGYGSDPSVVRLADRADQLGLLAFPRRTSESRFYRTGRLVSREGAGRWRLEVRDNVRRTYAVQASLATLAQPFVPCRVTLDGRPLPRQAWSYSAADATLQAEVTITAGVVEVLACGQSGAASAALPRAAAVPLAATGVPAAVAVAALGLVLAALALARRRR